MKIRRVIYESAEEYDDWLFTNDAKNTKTTR